MDELIEAGPGDELRYLQRRAEEELEMAQRSTVPEVTAAHYQFAEAYLDRIETESAVSESGEGAQEPALSKSLAAVENPAREPRRSGTESTEG